MHELMKVNKPVLPEGVFSALANLGHPLHSGDGGLYEVAVITNWNVSAFLELECRILKKSE